MSGGDEGLLRVWDDYYQQDIDEAPWGSTRPDPHVIAFVEHYRPAPAKRFLDVGCGHGKNTRYLWDLGHDALGVDFSPAAIDDARTRFPGVRFEVGRAEALDLADGSIDFLVDAGCMHTNPPGPRQQILASYARVVAPGGFLFVRLFRRYATSSWEEPFHHTGTLPVWGFSEEEARVVLEGTGFALDHFELDEGYGRNGCFYVYGRRVR